jgi:bifunctional enzyme CysN/CysC
MVTGASTVDLALVLVDARHGVVEQTRRHTLLTSLLGVPHLVICVNKMDLVGHEEAAFQGVIDEFTTFAAKLDLRDVTFIPISALAGDNVVDRSDNMPWYRGSSLLHHLETVYTASDHNLIDTRFPVQHVIRPHTKEHRDFRGYAGTLAGGSLRVGDDVLVLPSGLPATIAAIDGFDGPSTEAAEGDAVVVRLAEHIDISRGDMLCRPHNRPTITQDLDAMVCWMDDRAPLHVRGMYALLHTTRHVRAMVTDLRYELDISSLHRNTEAASLGLNAIGRIGLRTTAPLFVDDYHRNRTTGSFILVDEATNATVAAGMIRARGEGTGGV